MKPSNIARCGILSVLALGMLSSCHIYNKFDMPTDTELTKQYVEASEAPVDFIRISVMHGSSIS